MSDVLIKTRASRNPADGHLEELIIAPDAATVFDLTIASYVREALRCNESLSPGEAKRKALDLFHELANKDNAAYDRQSSRPELFVVAGEIDGAMDPVKSLGDYALQGGVAISPNNLMNAETL